VVPQKENVVEDALLGIDPDGRSRRGILAETGLLGHYLLILFDVVNCRISNANANRVCFFFALAILNGLGAGGIGGFGPTPTLLGRLRRFAVFRCVTC
jgi:hypothetical protein